MSENTKKQWGGKRYGAGGKTIYQTGERMKNRAIRMTEAQWEKLQKLGGSQWIRDRIDRAKSPEGDGNE